MFLKSLYKFISPKFQNLYLEYPVHFKPRYSPDKSNSNKTHKILNEIISSKSHEYELWLKKALEFKEFLWRIQDSKHETNSLNIAWNNNFLPGLDIVMLYTILSEIKPRKYIEIGSGNSTKVAFKAKNEQNLDVKIISYDPMPRAEIDSLSNKIIRKPFEDSDYSELLQLEANDILFVDNSHRVLPNSDAMVFFMEVLPQLKKGVIVQIHDVYLPYDYPQFMCDRFYNEQYAIAFFMMANPEKYTCICPNFFISEDKKLREIIAPIWQHKNMENVERHGGSFWFTIN